MSCGAMLETVERWCRVCGAPQDHRGEEAPENVSEYRRMLAELVQDGGLADWQQVELQRLRRRLGVGEATHQRLLRELAESARIPIEAFIEVSPLSGLQVGVPALTRLRILNTGEPTLFVQAAYGVTSTTGVQVTAAASPLEELEGTQLELVFTPEDYGHHQLEILLSVSEQEAGPYRPISLSPVRIQVGRHFRADAAIVDAGRGELREAEWIGAEEGEDWRPLRVDWADSAFVSSFQTRHAGEESASGDEPATTRVPEDGRTLAAERQARAQAARVEALRTAERHRLRQERALEDYQTGARARMRDWAQAEIWGRQEREYARREERLQGLLEWAKSHGIRFTDVPKPVSDEWLLWAEAQVMERVKSDCEG